MRFGVKKLFLRRALFFDRIFSNEHEQENNAKNRKKERCCVTFDPKSVID